VIGVLNGFAAIWIVVGVGWLLAHAGVLRADSQQVLTGVSFFAGNPALLLVMMSTADIRRLFAWNLLVTVLATIVTGLVYLLLARLVWKPDPSQRVIGCFCAAYVNAGNMGLPIAAYVLHDVTWIAPLLLVQVGVLQPLGLAMLDAEVTRQEGRDLGFWRYLWLPFRNPMTIAVLTGLLLNLAHLAIPTVLKTPLSMLGGLAVPTMLVAFGVSLRLGPLPGKAGRTGELVGISLLKVGFHPLLALALARLMGLDHAATVAVVVLAGLPTAQNVFTHAVRYQTDIPLARDVVFITSIASIVTVAALASLV